MDDYKEETYGERIADVYDDWYSGFDSASVQLLTELAHGGRVLELGIGTGRIAIPLMNSGVSVQGIDASEAMVAKLRAKPGGDKFPVIMGNFADVAVEGLFSLIYVVFNTLYCLLTQEEQIRCFQNVAKHLTPEGVFVVDAFMPDMKRYTSGQALLVTSIRDHEVKLDASEIELDKQLISAQHMVLGEHQIVFYPIKIRYIWPSEMDLMARLSGLQLINRWSDWKKNEFSAKSEKHISVYQPIR